MLSATSLLTTGRSRCRSPLATGARRGEVCALTWRTVDLDAGTIRIVEALQQIGRTVIRGSTKTAKSRTVTVPAAVVDELCHWRRRQAEQFLSLGSRPDLDTPVCTWPDGSGIKPEALTAFFHRLVKRLELPVRFHSLRHTHATALLAAGVHPKVAQERLGHASIAITMDTYSHVTKKLEDDAAAKVNDLFWKFR
jgi:integrase